VLQSHLNHFVQSIGTTVLRQDHCADEEKRQDDSGQKQSSKQQMYHDNSSLRVRSGHLRINQPTSGGTQQRFATIVSTAVESRPCPCLFSKENDAGDIRSKLIAQCVKTGI
jgi:hypothetical protein